MSQSPSSVVLAGPDATAGRFDEMVSGTGRLRAPWQALIGTLQTLAPGAFAERVERVHRQHEDIAIAYSFDGEGQGAEARRPFDLVPMLLPEPEFRALEAGLAQRARLIDRILADVYGERRLVLEGALPPSLIHGNPRFLRPCSRALPDGAPWLHVYAADVVRVPDGGWRVLADWLQSPAGIGFALQNRSILARSVPELFRAHLVERIEPFFDLWQARLAALAPAREGTARESQPRIAVMTPGPYNSGFFEHVYLARQLGATLVEGDDLTMRGGRVFVKTLGVLQPVDIILRFLDDDFCDPLELRGNSMLGVAGLLQAVRAGTVVIANALGAGLAETPALRPFLPRLAETMLGESLRLRSVEPGTAPIRSMVPVWTPEGLLPRPLTLRLFLVRDGDGFTAMPGGFAQVPHEPRAPTAPFGRAVMSKDTWVLAEEGEGARLPPRPAPRAQPVRRPVDELRSRTADDLFWLGRYTERLDNAARLMRAAAARLAVDRLGPGPLEELQHLLRLLIGARLIDRGAAELLPDGRGVFLALAAACGRERTLQASFAAIHRIAHALRDRLSNDLWRVVTRRLREARDRLEAESGEIGALIGALDNLVGVVAAFGGMASENMTRGSAWRFLDLGRRLERGLYAAKVLSDALASGRGSEAALGLALELCDSSITYRSRYFGAIHPAPVFDLVLLDETNPRGVAYQLRSIAQHLRDIAAAFERSAGRSEPPFADEILAAARAASLEALGDPAGRARLARHLGQITRRLVALSETITRAYFSHTRMPRAVGYDGPRP